jgi:hypothetical protein
MKKTLITATMLCFLAYSCSKSDLIVKPAGNSGPASTLTHPPAKKSGFFYRGYTTASGSTYCDYPKVNCIVFFEPFSALLDLDQAIEIGQVMNFFNSPEWQNSFDFFAENPAALTGLKNGSLNMVRQAESNRVIYIIVPTGMETTFTEGDIVLAVENNLNP